MSDVMQHGTVAVIGAALLAAWGGEDGGCTGTLIAPDLLLSAGSSNVVVGDEIWLR
jgi:hypothetical protein